MNGIQFAALFPGQGSQSVGMLDELAAAHPLIEKIFAQASQYLNYDLWDLVQRDPDQKLNLTQYTQLAMLVAGVSTYQLWCRSGGSAPKIAAGHSLGEYSALVCAQALEFADAVELVSHRGRLMQETTPADQGAMAAIIGLDEATVAEICIEAAEGDIIAPANFNAIGQIVVAGQVAAVDRAIVLAEAKGVRMAKKLPVSAPCHCEMLEPAAKEFAHYLEKTPFKVPQFAVISNVDVVLHRHPDDIRASLVKQLYNPVRWLETIQQMVAQDIEVMIEYGPGRVLTGLNKRIDRKIKSFSVHDSQNLQQALAQSK
ncbi:MAG: ACP S-malonyltransferase [Gammaproteobacteria bacterium]